MRRGGQEIHGYLEPLAIAEENALKAKRARETGRGELEPMQLHHHEGHEGLVRRHPMLAEIEGEADAPEFDALPGD